MEWLIIPVLGILLVLMLPRDFTAYSKRVVDGVTVEYGDKRGFPTVRVTLGGLVYTETFRVRSEAEDYFLHFDRVKFAEHIKLIIGE